MKRKSTDTMLIILVVFLYIQAALLWVSPIRLIFAQSRANMTDPRYHPDQLQGMPPSQGRIEPPPPGTPGMPPGAPGDQGSPSLQEFPMVSSYPTLPEGREPDQRFEQILEARYILHRWVLSDLMWGIEQLEKSDKNPLTPEQARKIYPAVKRLSGAVDSVRRSNILVENLLTTPQKEYILKSMKDNDFMETLVSAFPSSGDAEPVFGASFAIYDHCYQILKEKSEEN